MTAPRLGVVVLAAGLSKRMGGANKLLQDYKGRALLAWSLDAAAAAPVEKRVLIVSRDAAEVVALAAGRFEVLVNQTPEQGLASSLKLGISACRDLDGAIVCLGDMPDVSDEDIRALQQGWRAALYAIVPAHRGVWGNPVLLGRQAMQDAMTLTGDRGARALLKAHAEHVLVAPVDHAGVLRDFDTPEDFSA